MHLTHPETDIDPSTVVMIFDLPLKPETQLIFDIDLLPRRPFKPMRGSFNGRETYS